MAILRAFKAKHGDSLLLLTDGARVLIDGGPSGVYNQTLRDGLSDLEGKDDRPPRIDLLMVSHIDADHIDGILDLTAEMLEAREKDADPLVEIDRAWHNSFADAVAEEGKRTPEEVEKAATTAGLQDILDHLPGMEKDPHGPGLVLSSVAQGRRLRLDLKALRIDLNREFDHRLVLQDSAKKPWKKGDLTLTVIGPTQKEVDKLRHIWAKELPEILAKEGAAAKAAAAAAGLDTSVSNLASIVAVAEVGDKKALLTGDARGDMILEWLEKTGHLEPGESVHFHIVKLPHHGSDRNVSPAFFERITADHYVVCGNGGHGNPEPNMLDMLFTARPELDYAVHMTYGPDELKKHKSFKKAKNGPKLDAVLADPARRAVLRFPKGSRKHLDIPF